MKEQTEKLLKWFENGKSGKFSTLKEMMMQKRANINWVDDNEVRFFSAPPLSVMEVADE